MNEIKAVELPTMPSLLQKNRHWLLTDLKRHYWLYLLTLPAFIYILIFNYFPMYGVQIAFRDFMPANGILGSRWVGMTHFINFFKSKYFAELLFNTVGMSLYSLVVGFPLPIIFAIMLNELKFKKLKKSIQMIVYAPHFISTVVMVAMIITFLDPNTGVINHLIQRFGGRAISFMARPEWFKTIYVWSGVWQGIGWGSIIYFASLSSIDVELYEAAAIDGAGKLQKIIHIDIPGILPTVCIMLILNLGGLMSVGFEKVILMQNELNMAASDVISTYVYRVGLLQVQYSYSSAIGLFNSVINFVLLLLANTTIKKLGQSGLW